LPRTACRYYSRNKLESGTGVAYSLLETRIRAVGGGNSALAVGSTTLVRRDPIGVVGGDSPLEIFRLWSFHHEIRARPGGRRHLVLKPLAGTVFDVCSLPKPAGKARRFTGSASIGPRGGWSTNSALSGLPPRTSIRSRSPVLRRPEDRSRKRATRC